MDFEAGSSADQGVIVFEADLLNLEAEQWN